MCGERVPLRLDKEWVYLWISLLNQLYWVAGSVGGNIMGGFMNFDTKGLDFALTALFVVIFTDQWKSRRDHRPALVGVASSVACVIVFGAQAFIIPAMVVILAVLSLWYRRWENGSRKNGKEAGKNG